MTTPIDITTRAHEHNVLNFSAPPDGSWATTNLAEALPGVASPLGWSIWARAADRAARAPFHAMGAIDAKDLAYPSRSEDRVVNLFHGRIAIRVDFFCEMGDLVPGATGEAVARDAFGFVPPNFVSRSSRRRWPYFAVRMPVAFVRTPPRIRAILADNEAWYSREVRRTPVLDLAGARQQYHDAATRFLHTLPVNAVSIACVIQPVFTALSKLAAEAGVDAATLMRGYGSHEEGAMIENLWRLSRDEMTLEALLLRHGYHGPDEGELSNQSWREDPTPLLRTVEAYRAMANDASPATKRAAGAAERAQAEAALLAALPSARRPGARLVLKLARKHMPLRAVGKVAFLRTLDVARAAARRAGTLLVEEGVLDAPDDIFYLTSEELLGAMPDDPHAAVAERRALRAFYERLELPVHWTGYPEATPLAVTAEAESGDRLEGLGVSPGIVEGRIRVVADPADAEMEPGDILVGHTTDPSWASVMFVASALVVDIGGQLSHAAVVAREIGVACVMNTQIGTRVLKTGDLCRIDGSAGTVEILERAAP
jgi:pyruvate,water dikinase